MEHNSKALTRAGIVLLTESLQNKIAAGEVIERPASVVKELVENSIDSGATSISVDIYDAGKRMIRIRDDGGGMSAEELPLAIAPHATSKLHSLDDLFDIQTLGFRGEALASIASISELTLASRVLESVSGSELGVKGGKIVYQKETALPSGTTIIVRNLFFNTPVRRKFIKANSVECAKVSESVLRLALAHPEIEFILKNNDRDVFHLPRTADLHERIAAVFSPQFVRELIPIPEQPSSSISGYISRPSLSRANSLDQYVFLNRRFIKDRSISAAIKEAYRGLLPQRRFPATFLFIELENSEFDVNVHPTKIEVRFRDASAIYLLVYRALRYALQETDLTKQVTSESSQIPGDDMHSYKPGEEQKISFSTPEFTLNVPVVPVGFSKIQSSSSQWNKHIFASMAEPDKTNIAMNDTRFAYLGQVKNSYLIAEDENGVLLIDQHALHERLLYDELKLKNYGQQTSIQKLLFPEEMPLGKLELEHFEHVQGIIKELGFEVEKSSDDSIRIKAVPALLGRLSPSDIIADILNPDEDSNDSSIEDERERIIKSIACKAAIKAGDPISPVEAKSLLEKYTASSSRFTCPHGRPTGILMSWDDLEKQFKRK